MTLFGPGSEFRSERILMISSSGSEFFLNIDFLVLSIILLLSQEKNNVFSLSKSMFYRPKGLEIKFYPRSSAEGLQRTPPDPSGEFELVSLFIPAAAKLASSMSWD